jgi:hypothetical protein
MVPFHSQLAGMIAVIKTLICFDTGKIIINGLAQTIVKGIKT